MPCECERNAHPAEAETQRQTETAAEQAVCGLNALLRNERRTHRRVGYKNSVLRYGMYAMSNCNRLANELRERTYAPKKGEQHEIFEPKYRITTSSKYCDRVPQSSFVVNYFYPAVISRLSDWNCACRKGKGVDDARERFKDILRRADMSEWCLKVDMKSYFASIDHKTLYSELFEYITDEWARWFFEITVENSSNPTGLDLGSEVYQLAAVSFLNKLDHKLDTNGKYIRYQDDLLYVGTKAECRKALDTIKAEAERLKLTISAKKTYIQPIKQPVHFLGYSFMRHETGRVTMKRLRDKFRREKRKLKRMRDKGVPAERVQEHYQAVRAGLKKGTRSDLVKMDRFFNKLFGGKYGTG